MAFILHDHLSAAIEEKYPTLQRWVDYWVANPCTEQGDHTGDAFIAVWKGPGDKPDVAPLLARAQELAPTFVEADMRALRNQLLDQSDWTVQPDAPTNKALWAAYRQALRDLPTTAGWFTNIVWPSAPK